MINEVRVSRRARKNLRKVPVRVVEKFQDWVGAVEQVGLEEVRKRPGYHDEPLKGRRGGQRSIRLSVSYRAIYEQRSEGAVEFVSVEEVSKHDY